MSIHLVLSVFSSRFVAVLNQMVTVGMQWLIEQRVQCSIKSVTRIEMKFTVSDEGKIISFM